MRSLLSVSSRLAPILFVPAGALLTVQVMAPESITSSKLLALALALFCPELAHMAGVDLKNVLAVFSNWPSLSEEDSRLTRFYNVVASTVALEITGFYMALFSLPVGAAIIIASQLWFNLLADVQLAPEKTPPIVQFGASKRKLVIVANIVGLSFLLLWPIQAAQTFLALGLLILIVLFLLIKYGLPIMKPEMELEVKSKKSDEIGL